jgi:hypothetical protein
MIATGLTGSMLAPSTEREAGHTHSAGPQRVYRVSWQEI